MTLDEVNINDEIYQWCGWIKIKPSTLPHDWIIRALDQAKVPQKIDAFQNFMKL